MDRSFHYMIMISYSLFQKKVMKELFEAGLTPGQPKVLDFLSKHNGSIQKDIAHGCQIDPATLTGILSHMEESELIERRMKKGNRRSSYVYLTEIGVKKSIEISKVFLKIEEEVFNNIKIEEKQQFMDTFYKICSNMTDVEGLQ